MIKQGGYSRRRWLIKGLWLSAFLIFFASVQWYEEEVPIPLIVPFGILCSAAIATAAVFTLYSR